MCEFTIFTAAGSLISVVLKDNRMKPSDVCIRHQDFIRLQETALVGSQVQEHFQGWRLRACALTPGLVVKKTWSFHPFPLQGSPTFCPVFTLLWALLTSMTSM
jgi:hypothetical protein